MLRAFTSPPTISRLFTRPQVLAGLGAYGRHSREYASKILSSCPSCGTSLPTTLPACPKCRWIDTLDGTVRRHDVFEVPYAYSVDQTAVKQAFRKLQRVVHPDLWADSDHRFRAEQLSSYVNETHKMLLNPVAHAEYILGLNGVEIGEEEHVDDQEFIMDIFEQRSELEDCESPDAAKQLSNINQVKANEISSQLSKAIQSEAWQQAKELTIRLKYLRSIISAANAWPDTTSDH